MCLQFAFLYHCHIHVPPNALAPFLIVTLRLSVSENAAILLIGGRINKPRDFSYNCELHNGFDLADNVSYVHFIIQAVVSTLVQHLTLPCAILTSRPHPLLLSIMYVLCM